MLQNGTLDSKRYIDRQTDKQVENKMVYVQTQISGVLCCLIPASKTLLHLS